MRSVSKSFARAVVAVSIVMSLAVPAEARPGDGSWLEKGSKIIKIIKKIVIRGLGDGLTDPRP
jgi:hypothetical protein